MYSTHNERKSIVAENLVRTLNIKIYKYINIKNAYINNLLGVVNEYNNTYQTAIKMKPIDVKS